MSTGSREPLIMNPLIGIPLIQQGDDLAQIALSSLKKSGINLLDGDILVLAQKVVSKAEGRMVNLDSISPSNQAEELARETGKDPRIVELILQESNQVLRSRTGLIIVEHRLGFVCANAGIDRSNVAPRDGGGKVFVLLLPEHPDKSAGDLRQKIEKKENVRIGVVIIDSHGRAWRNGTVGITIGLSGVPGIIDKRGEKDLFDYQLRVTQIGAVDELAAAASLLMGQVDEGLPIIHVRGFPYPLREGTFQELLRDQSKDMFR